MAICPRCKVRERVSAKRAYCRPCDAERRNARRAKPEGDGRRAPRLNKRTRVCSFCQERWPPRNRKYCDECRERIERLGKVKARLSDWELEVPETVGVSTVGFPTILTKREADALPTLEAMGISNEFNPSGKDKKRRRVRLTSEQREARDQYYKDLAVLDRQRRYESYG